MGKASQFANIAIVNVAVFILPSLVTGRSFMSIQFLVLELRELLFTRDCPKIQKSEIPLSEFCTISTVTECCKMSGL